jgi:RHS repeat-associated protein
VADQFWQLSFYHHDANGTLMRKVGHTQSQGTVYIGGVYEKNVDTGAVTKYYYAGSQRIAVRQVPVLFHLVQDHLGGTALTQLSNVAASFQRGRYYPYGMLRSGNPATDKLYTGQQRETADGIYYYGSRFYNADIGRFLQPDSIVPEPGNPQALNRYSYVLNNPIRYNDPTGEKWDDGSKGGCTPKTCKGLKWSPSKDLKQRAAKRAFKLKIFRHLLATGNSARDSACTAYSPTCNRLAGTKLSDSLRGQGLPSQDASCAAGLTCGTSLGGCASDPSGWSCSSAAESMSGGGSCSFQQAAYGEGAPCTAHGGQTGGTPEEFLTDVAEAVGDVATADCLGFTLDAAAFGLNFVPGGIAARTAATQILGSAAFGAGLAINGQQGDTAGIGLDSTGVIMSNLSELHKGFFAASGVAGVYSGVRCAQSIGK